MQSSAVQISVRNGKTKKKTSEKASSTTKPVLSGGENWTGSANTRLELMWKSGFLQRERFILPDYYLTFGWIGHEFEGGKAKSISSWCITLFNGDLAHSPFFPGTSDIFLTNTRSCDDGLYCEALLLLFGRYDRRVGKKQQASTSL